MCLGIPGRIVAIVDADNLLGMVDVCGVRRVVNLNCIIDAAHSVQSCIGDWVLVHVGFAMSRLDADDAHATLELLRQLGEAQSEIDAMQATAAGA
jgi:hydrogenase expression/formation protein HypC